MLNSGSDDNTPSGSDTELSAAFFSENPGFIAKIHRYTCRRMPSRQLADKLNREIMTSFVAFVENCDVSEDELPGVLYAIASKKVAEFRKREHRSLENFTDFAGFFRRRDKVLIVNLRRDVKKALEALPSRQRRVLELRYIDSFTAAETAKIIGKSVACVTKLTDSAIRSIELGGMLIGNDSSGWRTEASEAQE